jgi:four helix bundle protein
MFICYQVSIELVQHLRDLVPIIKRHDRDLADQLHRAATSVALNLAEGQRLSAGNQRKHYEIALGSANEVKAALDVAAAWGYTSDTQATQLAARGTLDRLLALLWRLNHGHRHDARVARGAPEDSNGGDKSRS